MGENTTFTREKTRKKVIRFLLYFAITFFVIAGRAAQWVLNEWGDLTLDEVIFTMTQPLNGTDSGIIWSFILYAVVPHAPEGCREEGYEGKKASAHLAVAGLCGHCRSIRNDSDRRPVE